MHAGRQLRHVMYVQYLQKYKYKWYLCRFESIPSLLFFFFKWEFKINENENENENFFSYWANTFQRPRKATEREREREKSISGGPNNPNHSPPEVKNFQLSFCKKKKVVREKEREEKKISTPFYLKNT